MTEKINYTLNIYEFIKIIINLNYSYSILILKYGMKNFYLFSRFHLSFYRKFSHPAVILDLRIPRSLERKFQLPASVETSNLPFSANRVFYLDLQKPHTEQVVFCLQIRDTKELILHLDWSPPLHVIMKENLFMQLKDLFLSEEQSSNGFEMN